MLHVYNTTVVTSLYTSLLSQQGHKLVELKLRFLFAMK